MLPQSEFESPMFASAQAPVAIAAISQDRALIGLLRSVVDPTNDLILVNSEAELTPHLNGRRVSVALLDSMFIEGDLAALAERLRANWNDLVLVVVGTAEEQSKVASQITSGVVYRFLHRPVSAPRVRLFVEAALRRHEVENVERTLEQTRPDFSRFEAAKSDAPRTGRSFTLPAVIGGLLLAAAIGGWFVFSRGKAPATAAPSAQLVSPPAAAEPHAAPPAVTSKAIKPAAKPVTVEQRAPAANVPAQTSAPVAPEPRHESAPAEPSVAERLRQATSPEPVAATPAPGGRVPHTTESAVETAPPPAPPPPPALTFEQRLADQLSQAEAALQRGDLAKPPGKNAVELFRGALELDPSNTLAKAGLVRVADRLLTSAEASLTAGKADEARKMVDIAETLTPATARGAFLMMQIEMEQERAALVAKHDGDAQDKLERGATYIRLAGTRLRSGALIEPAQDNARFYIEAARQLVPEDPALGEVARGLQKELLTRAAAAASAGNAAETERWLANADSIGVDGARQEFTNVRRMLAESLLGVRNEKISTLTKSFDAALAAGQLLQPATASAKSFLFELIKTDGADAAVPRARQGLGQAYLRELRGALAHNDIAAADGWLQEANTISYNGADLNAATTDIATARERAAQASSVVGANSLERIEYVAPKFPANTRESNGWVELEFTVRTDGSTGDIVVTNSYPRRLFDSSAVRAVGQWRYKPVMRAGRAVDQRAAVRIRFSDE